MIKTLLLALSLTSNVNSDKVEIFTNTQCGDVCVEVEVEKARIMIFSMDGYIKRNDYINRGLNRINTCNLESGDYYVVLYVNDVYEKKDIFTTKGNLIN